MPKNVKEQLTSMQRKFIDAYITGMSATQAAIKAGYSRNSAGAQGENLLRNTKVKAELDRIEREAAKKAVITREEVIQGITRIATKDDTKDRDRLKAYELLAKILKMFDAPEDQAEKTIKVTICDELKEYGE